MRPEQWVKNIFVFVPMFFGGKIADGQMLLLSMATFVAFSLVASSVYCLNDITDAEDDRRHPRKCLRPVAAGTVTKRRAYTIMAVTLLLSMAVMAILPSNGLRVAIVVLGYYALNVAYCLWLKHHSIVDVCLISFGFVLRLMAGGAATGVTLSKWIVLMTFLLALFLALAKRRDDVLRMKKTGQAHRKTIARYNLVFMDQAITITASVTLVCYIIYTVSPEVAVNMNTNHLYLTSVFVMMGLLRYIQITVVDERSGDPTAVAMHDRFTQAVVACWGLSFFVIIYLL